jgi:hypothetical protein
MRTATFILALLVSALLVSACGEDVPQNTDTAPAEEPATPDIDTETTVPNALSVPDADTILSDAPPHVEPRKTPTGSTPQPNRILFVPGTSSATITGNLNAESVTYYTLRARQGQTLRVNVTGSTENHDVVFTITGPSGEELMGEGGFENEWDGELPETGDYVIMVDMIESEYSDYNLEVSVE